MDEPWYRALKDRWEADGPKAVGAVLGYSASAVTGVVKGYYGANIDAFRQRVIERLTEATVDCPVLGELQMGACAEHRARPFAPTNPDRVRLWRACRSCPHNPNRTS